MRVTLDLKDVVFGTHRDLDVDTAVAAWPSWDAIETDIRTRLDGSLAEHCVKETRTKYLDADGLRRRLTARVREVAP